MNWGLAGSIAVGILIAWLAKCVLRGIATTILERMGKL